MCLGELTIDSDIDDIGTCCCRCDHAGGRNASRIVRVYVNRHIRVLGADAADEPVHEQNVTRSQLGMGRSCDLQPSSLRLEQTGHVFDAQNVDTFGDDLIHEVKVIVKCILSLGLACDVATVANNSFDYTTGLLGGINAEFHLRKGLTSLSDDKLGVPYILCSSTA